MKLVRMLTGCVAAACCLSACSTPFVSPVHTPASTILDPGIVGAWVSEGPSQYRAIVAEPSDGSYPVTVVVSDKGAVKTALNLEVALTDIEGTQYADLFLARSEREKLVGEYGFLVLPVHQVARVERDADSLQVWFLKGEWAGRVDGRFALRTVPIGGGETTVVLADTDRVRKLLAEHAADPAMFADPIVFRRTR